MDSFCCTVAQDYILFFQGYYTNGLILLHSCARLHYVFPRILHEWTHFVVQLRKITFCFSKDITRMDSFCCTVAQDYILFFPRILHEWTLFAVQLRKITFCFFQGYYTNGLILLYSSARLHFGFFKDITRMDSF